MQESVFSFCASIYQLVMIQLSCVNEHIIELKGKTKFLSLNSSLSRPRFLQEAWSVRQFQIQNYKSIVVEMSVGLIISNGAHSIFFKI